jgi:hypothetical protein
MVHVRQPKAKIDEAKRKRLEEHLNKVSAKIRELGAEGELIPALRPMLAVAIRRLMRTRDRLKAMLKAQTEENAVD